MLYCKKTINNIEISINLMFLVIIKLIFIFNNIYKN